MYIISVIPIARGIGKETLSYFTSSNIKPGDLVEIPLRKKTAEALVVSCQDAMSMKSEIKSAGFTLKKIGKLSSKPYLPKELVVTAERVAKYHASTIGATLNTLLASKLIKEALDTKEIRITDSMSQSYKGISRPFIDMRYVLKIYAEESGKKFSEEEFTPKAKIEKITEKHKKEDDMPFTSLGKEFQKELFELTKKDGHVFIFGTRKGHSGTVLCQDCGQAVQCPKCNSPITLHMKKQKEQFNELLCHHCGYKESALIRCVNCDSWRLKAYGLGIEKVEEDVKEFCKKHKIDAYIQRIDSTLKLTPKKMKGFVDTHFEKPKSILIATEIILPYLIEHSKKEKNSVSIMPSMDTLLSLPDFSIGQKIWRLLCVLDNITEQKVIIQTRNPDHSLLSYWKNSDTKGYKDSELTERKRFGFPPFTVLIKLTLKGRKERIAEDMKKVTTLLAEWKPAVFPAFIKSIMNQHILHALIKIPASEWPNEELLKILLSLPPSVAIDVNPKSLL